MPRSGLFLSALAALALTAVSPSHAAEVTIKMVDEGPNGTMDFEPNFVKIAPGDTVKFVATNQGHNVETIKGMAPEGTPVIKSPIGKDETITFDKEGVYGFKCTPHYTMGMVALVVVGSKLDNLDAAKEVKTNKKSKERFEPLFAKAAQ